jgi:hypothetical protein
MGVDGRPRRSRNFMIVGAACVVSLVALLLLGINTLQAGFACHSENTYCAYSASKDGVYTGAFRGTGSPRVVEASFGSLIRELRAAGRRARRPLLPGLGPRAGGIGDSWHQTATARSRPLIRAAGRLARHARRLRAARMPDKLDDDPLGSRQRPVRHLQFVLLIGLAVAALTGTVLLVMSAASLIADVALSGTLWTRFG